MFRDSSLGEVRGLESFDLLRGKIEISFARPSTIAIISSTRDDGKDFTALGLARSFSKAGYTTLLIDTAQAMINVSKGLSFDDLSESDVFIKPTAEGLNVLPLGDERFRKSASRRGIEKAIAAFKSRFEYIIINSEVGILSPFASSILSSADVVLATLMKGRRRLGVDVDLAAALESYGPRFVGVVALSSSAAGTNLSRSRSFNGALGRQASQLFPVDGSMDRLERAKSPN